MQLCEICKEPAARCVMSGRENVARCYCYVHAVEAGVLEVPLDLLKRAAAETGYPANAVIFVLESLIRAGCFTEVETADEAAWTIEAPKTPLEVCVSLSREAVERFQQQAGLALNYWKLRRGNDLRDRDGLGGVGEPVTRSGRLPVGAGTDGRH